MPVGGMWVESDTNMPGCEALVRQFVHGKRFFLREFGVRAARTSGCRTPSATPAALPQIAAAAGSQCFLTQKISWNETNVLPHHTFWWEGIDGTRIFTHFPPVDTYNSRLSACELAKAERQYAEQGHGDDLAGPVRLRRRRRRADPRDAGEGAPHRQPRGLADGAHRHRRGVLRPRPRPSCPNPGTWSGEMYLETHRGTYTSQLRTKQGNRRSEHLLRAGRAVGDDGRRARRARRTRPTSCSGCWETVLLQQFHDILPGTLDRLGAP